MKFVEDRLPPNLVLIYEPRDVIRQEVHNYLKKPDIEKLSSLQFALIAAWSELILHRIMLALQDGKIVVIETGPRYACCWIEAAKRLYMMQNRNYLSLNTELEIERYNHLGKFSDNLISLQESYLPEFKLILVESPSMEEGLDRLNRRQTLADFTYTPYVYSIMMDLADPRTVDDYSPFNWRIRKSNKVMRDYDLIVPSYMSVSEKSESLLNFLTELK